MKIIVAHAVVGLVPNKGGVDFWGKTRHYERKWTAWEVKPDLDGSVANEAIHRDGSATTYRIKGVDYVVIRKIENFKNKRALSLWIGENKPEVVSYGERR